jgi:hypothetical protein
MAEASKPNWRPTLMLGVVLVFAAATAGAVPLAERAAHPEKEKAAKSKAVHFIENRPEANAKVHVEMKGAELPLLVPEKLPVSEPQPLELKGVRG